MRRHALPGVIFLFTLLASCGGGMPTTTTQGCLTASCAPSCDSDCSGKVCGSDGCGGVCGVCSSQQSCIAGSCVPACAANCSGRICGDDGCGGSCGACPSGATCVAGSCQASSSPGCPQGGTCKYLERTALRYDCASPDDCQPSGFIGTYGTFEACQTWGCMGGNSRCGDQNGNSDPERWSCERCRATCHDGFPTACSPANESAQGCRLWDSTWGGYLADCICG